MDGACRLWCQGDKDGCLEELKKLRSQGTQNAAVSNNLQILQPDTRDSEGLEATWRSLRSIQDAGDNVQNASSSREGCSSSSEVVSYNMAVVKFLKREYDVVLSILQPLFENVYSFDDGLALGVCFLMMDCYLGKREPLECKPMLRFLETLLSADAEENHQTNIPTDWNSSVADVLRSGTPPVGGTADMSSQLQLLSYPCTSKLMMISNDQEAEANGINLHEIPGQDNFKTLLCIYRARILFAMGHRKEATNQLKSVLSRDPWCVPALFLKAQICLVANKYDKATALLDRCMQACPEGSQIQSIILNNMGSLEYKLGNMSVASLCFSTSLSPKPDADQLRTLYNIGLISLRQQRYEDALSKFKAASTVLFREPALWVRMAECCIALEQPLPKREWKTERPVLDASLPSITILPAAGDAETNSVTSKDGWLGMAYTYLQNALVLLKGKDATEGQKTNEHYFLSSVVYTKLAFVVLSLNQPERCLFFTEQLKKLPEIHPEHAFYGRTYEVEALCLMDQSQEAAEVMRVLIDSFDATAFAPRHPAGGALDVQGAQKMMYQNLASVHCANRDFAKAKHCVQRALLLDPGCKKSLMILLYIEVAVGNKAGALEMLRAQRL